ncbi:MAG: phosphatase PAP2 family protein [Alphaproteobacteria bacterium]|nr:phosphatase PAP2 family protein [Alphaproteobacteria bacterium]
MRIFWLAPWYLLVAASWATAATEPIYLSPAQVDFTGVLAPPPADDSPAGIAELEELRQIAKTRTDAEWRQAMWDDHNETIVIYNDVLGGIELMSLPKTKALFDQVQNDRRAATDRAKDHYLRKRPSVRDPSLKTCGGVRMPLSSFPSGHSSWGFASAVVLAAMVPDKEAEILARAKTFAESRMICGMHHRSDTVAGQVLGTVVAERLLAHPAFRAKFDDAAAELRAALKK